MNLIFTPNRAFKRMFVNILSIVVILAMAFPVTGGVSAEGEEPGLRAFPDQDRADGMFWPVGALVYLTINGSLFGSQTADNMGYVDFPLTEYDLVRGDILTLTSGEISATHTARQLFVDNIDLDAQTVSGTVDGGQQTVHVWSGESHLYVDSDVDGSWSVDFSGFTETVLFPGACGNAEAWEGPGSTIIDWCIPGPPPNPHFTVFPEWEWFDGLDWPDGANVSITVEGKPECATEKESWDYFFNGNFGEGCDLVVGDLVTFTDGEAVRTHTVRNLAVTGVDAEQDTVTGLADEGETVYVWPHATGEQLQVVVEAGGGWQVDFTDLFDLVPGSDGRSEIRDEAGNSTAVDWHVPNPRFVVFPEWEFFDGIDWPDGAIVNISVDGKPECSIAKESSDFFFNGNFGEGCDIAAGDIVTFTDGATIRTHTIQNLAVTNVDIPANTVGGLADSDAVVQVWPHETGAQLLATADSAGSWQVDFSGVFDLVEGSCGRSQIYVDENATAVDWCAPKPWLIAFPENEAVEAWEWPVGSTVTLTIDQAPGLEWNGIAEVTTWGDPRTYVRFDFADAYNLNIGDVVTLTGAGGIVRMHTVQNLSVSDVNAVVDTVSGTADDGALVRIWPHGHDQTSTLQVTTGNDGTWLADFTSVGFDLVPGIGGRSEVRDEAGNSTAVDWNVSLPGWEQLNDSGFGNPLTRGVTALATFRSRLYAGASNWETGAELWRLGYHGEWKQVRDAGFGSGAANPAVIDLIVFDGRLYAGTGWNTEYPGQVWRSADGIHWQPVTTDGFGNSDNIAITNFVAFKGMLYAGTGSVNGSAQIWRSNTGKPGTWKQVARDGPGISGNVTGFAVYKNSLYAAIEPPGGVGAPIQVWQSRNGSDWTLVTVDGFGDAQNESTGGFAQFGGYLYLGTRNETSGAQLWRTADGLHWQQVVADGFADLNNIKIESLLVYDDSLYAATYNLSMGLQIWRSEDGIQWDQVVANGFGDSGNFSTLWNSATLKYRGRILVGTWNDNDGGELWMFTP